MLYQDLPVFPLIGNLEDAPDYEIAFDPRRVSLGFGAQPAAPVQLFAKRSLTLSVIGKHDTRRTVQGFMAERRGREGAFWFPCYLDAGDVVASPDASTIDLQAQGLVDAFAEAPAMHLLIIRANGSTEAVAVDNVTANSATVDRIALSDALSGPLTSGDLVCRLYLVRLARTELTWQISGEVCRLSLNVVEKPTDYSSLPTLPDTLDVWMYRIIKRVEQTELYDLRLTSAPFNVSDGSTWQSWPIEHSSLQLSLESQNDTCEVQMYDFEGNPFEDWEPRHWGWPIEFYVIRAKVDPATGIVDGSSQIVFRGEVAEAKPAHKTWEISLRSPLARPSRVPRFQIQARCNHRLYGPYCTVAAGDFAVDGTITAINPLTLTVELTSDDLTGKGADYLKGGKLSIGTGLTKQIRTIVSATVLSSTVHRLDLNIALPASVEDEDATALPGCDRSITTCASKFDNRPNFGGFPYAPADNPAIKAIELTGQDIEGGKK